MQKNELIQWIKHRLGYPMVRVELHDVQIESCINEAREEFIKWAVGNATEETCFTLALSANIVDYELPAGVTEVIKVKEFDIGGTGINTLFSVENYLYNSGALSFLDNLGGYSMVDYHLALDFIDTLDRYMPDKYNWWYNKSTNKISIRPTPTFDGGEMGYLMVRSFMMRGTDEYTTTITNDMFNYLWDETWIKKYSLACAKEMLGMIRRKFSNFSSIGNQGISLDGDSLISEGQQEKERLMEQLKVEEDHEGWPILIS